MKEVNALKEKILNGEILDCFEDRNAPPFFASTALNIAALMVDDPAFDDTVACSLIDGVICSREISVNTNLLLDLLIYVMDVSPLPDNLCRKFFGRGCPAELGFEDFMDGLEQFPDKRAPILLVCARRHSGCLSEEKALSILIQKTYLSGVLPRSYVLSSLATSAAPPRLRHRLPGGPLVVPVDIYFHEKGEEEASAKESDEKPGDGTLEPGFGVKMIIDTYHMTSDTAEDFADSMRKYLTGPALEKFNEHRTMCPGESLDELYGYVITELLPDIMDNHT